MKNAVRTLAVVLTLALTTQGCASLNNTLGSWGTNLSDAPATVTCYSGGKEVYKTITRGKVTTGAGDMASFYDANGHLVEAYADCFYVYDQR